MRMLTKLLQERRVNPRKQQSDFFDYVLEELKKEGTILTEPIALDLMFVLLFASYETTSLALTLAMKFLSDHPSVLQRLTVRSNPLPKNYFLMLRCSVESNSRLLQEEHDAILRQRGGADSGLTWREYKSMTYTFQFINETVRLANIVPGIFRRALREIRFKGMSRRHQLGWHI